MNLFIKKIPRILIITLFLLVSFFAYDFFNKSVSADENLTTQTSGQSSLIDPEEALLLSKIESIQLDGRIFTDLTFFSLQDFTTPLIPQAVGKANPFAPFSGSVSTVVTSTAKKGRSRK